MPRFIYWLLFFPIATFAQGQMPSDNDLKTAYCIAPIESMIENTDLAVKQIVAGSALHREGLSAMQKYKDNLNRASTYLDSKKAYLDQSALAMAQKRGQSDVAGAYSEMLQCARACGPAPEARTQSGAAWRACVNQCDGGVAVKRMAACETLDWLPY